jgi:hypothetical protein
LRIFGLFRALNIRASWRSLLIKKKFADEMRLATKPIGMKGFVQKVRADREWWCAPSDDVDTFPRGPARPQQ